MSIAALILAAGSSTRFGSGKQLVRIGGRTMPAIVADTAASVGLEPVIAVLPPGVDAPAGVVPVRNDQPSAGLSRSLRVGLARVEASDAEAAIILLADQPTVDPEVLVRVATDGGRAPIAAAFADGRIGPPILIRREAFDLASQISGDEGLRRVIDEHPELVARIPVGAHAPDVDTPTDLDRVAPICPGCGERFLDVPLGNEHPYIGASAGCWSAFAEVLAREFGDPAYGSVHRHTVDVYSVQHPGIDRRRERQSVALHLIGICHWLEHDLGVPRLNVITQRLASEDRDWPWLAPPMAYDMTVVDVRGARDGAEHRALVRAWAEAVWAAWSGHQPTVRRWADEALG